MSLLSEFIFRESSKYIEKDRNLFAISFGQTLRYYNFLTIVTDRYKKASAKLVPTYIEMMKLYKELNIAKDGWPTTMNDEQKRLADLMEEVAQLEQLVLLEIESFYMLAKIFLDKTALFIQNYFGTARGISLVSHHNLVKYNEKFRLAKGLVYPQGFPQSIIFLKEHICDYRDKQISHLYNQKIIRITSWDDAKRTMIFDTYIYPTETEKKLQAQSPQKLQSLMQAIDTYIQHLITLIESNRSKTRFELK
jgi:hypothetical protein